MKWRLSKTIEKINDIKRWFFEKINKIDKTLARLIDRFREVGSKVQGVYLINKLRNERGEVKNNTTMSSYIPITDSLKEIDKFLETYNSSRLNQEEIKILKGPIAGKKLNQ